MNIFSRVWTALFGPYIVMATENVTILMQRGYYGELMITSRDEYYSMHIKLTGEQAGELARWMAKTGGSLNPPTAKGRVIQLSNKRPKV